MWEHKVLVSWAELVPWHHHTGTPVLVLMVRWKLRHSCSWKEELQMGRNLHKNWTPHQSCFLWWFLWGIQHLQETAWRERESSVSLSLNLHTEYWFFFDLKWSLLAGLVWESLCPGNKGFIIFLYCFCEISSDSFQINYIRYVFERCTKQVQVPIWDPDLFRGEQASLQRRLEAWQEGESRKRTIKSQSK